MARRRIVECHIVAVRRLRLGPARVVRGLARAWFAELVLERLQELGAAPDRAGDGACVSSCFCFCAFTPSTRQQNHEGEGTSLSTALDGAEVGLGHGVRLLLVRLGVGVVGRRAVGVRLVAELVRESRAQRRAEGRERRPGRSRDARGDAELAAAAARAQSTSRALAATSTKASLALAVLPVLCFFVFFSCPRYVCFFAT